MHLLLLVRSPDSSARIRKSKLIGKVSLITSIFINFLHLNRITLSAISLITTQRDKELYYDISSHNNLRRYSRYFYIPIEAANLIYISKILL